ncbi:MAG TPA: hypothetical protein VMA72_17115 [Streptosporangiaceae bacterium]|nr:hypothetical protein [Streptosporangiaceae bacterium]
MTDEASGESGVEGWIQGQFAFLADHGFAVDRVTQETIQWRNGDRTIELFRDWRDGTLDLNFACGAEPSGRRTFGLQQALQLVDPEAWPSHGWQAPLEATTRKYIAELAALVSAHLGAFLDNEPELWHLAADLTRDQASTYTTQLVDSQLRRQADTAWETRDWPAVISRYEKLHAMGTPLKGSEVKRLLYARKQS